MQTTAERYTAARLVLTAGPWAGQVLARQGAFLRVMRQVVQWFGTRDDALFRRDVFPLYIADTPQGHFYGFPVLNANGAKVARHYGAPELTAPSEIERSIKPEDEETARAFLREHLPMIDGPCRRASVCIYTLTPDRHFVIDLAPRSCERGPGGGLLGARLQVCLGGRRNPRRPCRQRPHGTAHRHVSHQSFLVLAELRHRRRLYNLLRTSDGNRLPSNQEQRPYDAGPALRAP